MKKISLFISVASILFCFILTGVLAWYGYFSTVSVLEKPVGPYTMVYKVYVGAPAGIGSVLDEISQSLITEFHVEQPVKFGLYYDDPKVTPPEQCRTLVGCIIENEQEGDLHAISEKYTVAILPRGMAVVVDYPYCLF
jgi:DNA gyrase inhibitor GyrI